MLHFQWLSTFFWVVLVGFRLVYLRLCLAGFLFGIFEGIHRILWGFSSEKTKAENWSFIPRPSTQMEGFFCPWIR